MQAAGTPAAAAVTDTRSEAFRHGRMAAAVRVMLTHATIVVRFSADGAASIERLEETKSEKPAGGLKARPDAPTATT
eukprot:7044460-Prymnesium_polylepis.1